MPFIDKVRRSNEVVEFDFKIGSRIQFWSGHLPVVLTQHVKPDVIIVFLGTNNFADTTLPDLTPILSAIHSTGARCIWVGPTSVHGKPWPIDALLRSAVAPCVYVDTEALDIPLADGVHPTAGGALKWLQAVWSVKDGIA
jgi:lysophospholipase L1-like esterase